MDLHADDLLGSKFFASFLIKFYGKFNILLVHIMDLERDPLIQSYHPQPGRCPGLCEYS